MNDVHLKTYTAGEDSSRLAAVAKELGLRKQRQPRKQVRSVVESPFTFGAFMKLIQDPTSEDALMRSVYTSRNQQDDRGRDDLIDRMYNSSGVEAFNDLAEIPEFSGEGDKNATALGGSMTSAVLGIIKGMVGPAILYLPHGFAGAGYAVAFPVMLIATAMYLYSSRCLLQAWKFESSKNALAAITERTGLVRSTKRVILSYPELAYRALGPRGEALVKTGIALMQSGVCLTYLIFVPHNLHTSLLTLTGIDISPEVLLTVMILVQIPLSWIRDIRKLTLTNFLANILILYGLLLCLGFSFSDAASTAGMGRVQSIYSRFTNLEAFRSQWFLFIGTSVLLFEGSITLLVPLQEAISSKKEREQFPTIYLRVILCIICFYGFFGIVCWMAFGNEVNIVLTTSLPSSILATSVQLAYSLAVTFTFPLQNFPALEIACKTIENSLTGSCGKSSLFTKRNFISSVLVIALAFVAIVTMDDLDKVVSLMGSLLGCPIAFVFPPLIHSYLCKDHITDIEKWCNRIVIAGGLLAMILASVITILEW